MREQPLIYEIEVEVESSAAPTLDDWLPGVVEETLRLSGFLDARILRDAGEKAVPVKSGTPADVPDMLRGYDTTGGREKTPVPAGATRRSVQFEVEDHAALERFLSGDAKQLHDAARARFGERLMAWRSLINPADATALPAEDARYCRNCSASLRGQYCMVCGQRDRSRMISLWELLRDFLGDLFDLDSRLWRTVFPLLFRPGRLTRDYLAGRRVAYTPPLRLYLVLSVGFFLLATWGGNDNLLKINGDGEQYGQSAAAPGDVAPAEAGKPGSVPAPPPPQGGPDPNGAENDLAVPDDPAAPDEDPDEGSFCQRADLATGVKWLDTPAVQGRLRRACDRIEADQGAAFLGLVVDNLPTMVLVFLPVIALVMKFLYLGSRRYYVEHLLFFLHLHSFVFLSLGLLILLHRAPAGVPMAGTVAGILTAAFVIYTPVYLFKSMRLVYGQGRLLTAIKFVLLQAAYVIGMLLTFLMGILFTALTI